MNKSVLEIMNKVILSDKTVNIKLLGDSITHGVGGTGFKQDGEPIVREFARNKDGFCWAKLFKDFMEQQYNCTVTNNACTGTNIEFVINNFNTLVSENDDIVICTIGTNNRHQNKDGAEKKDRNEWMKNFYNNILRLNSKFRQAGKDVIFVANIPASAENETDKETYWRIMHMNDVNDLYTKASVQSGFAFISMYNMFLEYCDVKDIDFTTLLADGLHPNNEGYEVMFKLLLSALGISNKIPGVQ